MVGQRDFSAVTIFGFTMILIASWEAVLSYVKANLN